MELFLLNINPLLQEDTFNKKLLEVSKSQQNKVNRLVKQNDRELCLGGQLILNLQLNSQGFNPLELNMSVTKYGKPYFDGVAFDFSVSHSYEYVAVAFSNNSIGCDIEKERKINPKIAERFFTTKEYKHIKDIENSEERKSTFFKIWTLKESYIKAVGKGLAQPLNSFEVEVEKLKGGEITIGEYNLHQYNLAGYKIAVCAKEPIDIKITHLDFNPNGYLVRKNLL